MQAQQYDMFGKRMAADQAVQQQQTIEAQGRAAAMPAEAQARGLVGAETEKAKAAQAGLQTAQEYHKAEKESDRMYAEQKELGRLAAQEGRTLSASERSQYTQISKDWNAAMNRANQSADPQKAIVELTAIAKDAEKSGSPRAQGYLETVIQAYGLPLADQIAPKTTPQQKDQLAKALVFVGGDVSKLPPELKALVSAK